MRIRGLHVPVIVAVLGLIISIPARAENALEEIVVTATRTQRQLSDVPVAASIVNQQEIQQGRQELGLDESLNKIPGLFIMDRYNFAQDLRISIRGAGSRATFGIRGIKIYIDGIPATTADGQGGVDDIDLGSIARVEVLRGPASSLYGSSAGGVISIFTEDGPKTPFVQASATVGQYDMQKYQLKSGGQYDKLNYLVNLSYVKLDGYRQHSQMKQYGINSKFRYTFDDASNLTMIINAIDSPTANDPGSLPIALVKADPRQAWSGNLAFNSGEALDQQRIGLVYKRDISDNQHLTLNNFYLWRNFITFLPFPSEGVSAFQRFFYGGGGKYDFTTTLLGHNNDLTVGFDVEIQRDDRQRYDNNFGIKGPQTQNQLEKAESYGFYFRNEFAITDNLLFSVGGRYDIIDMAIVDHFLSNGDQSGALHFRHFDPTVGLVWHFSPNFSIYGNYGTAFETPTFTEVGGPTRNLGAAGINLAGFNNVKSQTADSFELGVRGHVWERMNFSLAAYTMKVKNEVVNVATLGNRGEFQNADTRRKGIEAEADMDITDTLKITASYTYSHFKFGRFPTNPAAEGNWLPVIPQQQFYTELNWHHPSGVYAAVELHWVDQIYANNDNTAISGAYTVANFRVGDDYEIGNLTFSPYLGVKNFTNEKYNGNVRPNSFGARYYEPAPTRNVYGGLKVRYDFN
jgi:iron complex outermembrane receptor protein